MGKRYLLHGRVSSSEEAASRDRGLIRGGPLLTSRLSGHFQSTIICFVVNLSEVQTGLPDIVGACCACISGITQETFKEAHNDFLFFIFLDNA